MIVEKSTYTNYDLQYIFEEQQATFRHIFNLLDTSKIAFVGGVADYINLREYYHMPVHDLDVVYENEEDLKPIIETDGVKRYKCNFYKFNTDKVLVSEFFVNQKRVHIDYFKRNFFSIKLSQSVLLGEKVWHASFQEMKKFHNDQIGMLTSDKMGKLYDWKRLYKHSKKASLYNNIAFLEEKNLLHTLTKKI